MCESPTIQDSIYPLTIVADRYNGIYSGGRFIAWNLDADEIPFESFGDDVDCYAFWLHNKIICGKGSTVEEAIANLYIELNRGEDDD